MGVRISWLMFAEKHRFLLAVPLGLELGFHQFFFPCLMLQRDARKPEGDEAGPDANDACHEAGQARAQQLRVRAVVPSSEIIVARIPFISFTFARTASMNFFPSPVSPPGDGKGQSLVGADFDDFAMMIQQYFGLSAQFDDFLEQERIGAGDFGEPLKMCGEFDFGFFEGQQEGIGAGDGITALAGFGIEQQV